MTLGIAAKRSTKIDMALETLGGAYSAKKMAAPTPMGTAIKSATKAVTQVPKINGRAPKFSATGSQTRLNKKPIPNLLIEGSEAETN